MISLSIVPLRKMPSSKPWLDYYYDDKNDIAVGQIVEIKIRGKLNSGIVWKINNTASTKYRLIPVTGIKTNYQVISELQRNLISRYADIYRVSLSSVVRAVIPDKIQMGGGNKYSRPSPKKRAKNDKLWYRSRTEAINYLKAWGAKSNQQWRIIFVPTVNDANKLKKILPLGIVVHGQIGNRAYRIAYQKVLNEPGGLIIGTNKALFLPYQQPPMIMVDQIEHRQYKQESRRPFSHLPTMLRRFGLNFSWTSPAPDLATYKIDQPVAPSAQTNRVIADLAQQSLTWLSIETENKLEQQVGSIVWILPRQGFAASLICADCRWALECPNCQRRIRLNKNRSEEIICQSCRHTFVPATECPKCGSHVWKAVGIGPEFWKQELKKSQMYQRSVIDTYKAVDRLSFLKRPVTVVIVSGEAMIDQPDYSINERGWQYLHRLEAELAIGDTIIIQTYNPENDFWQDWKADRKKGWYQKELELRTKFGLPPVVENMILTAPDDTSDENIKNFIKMITQNDEIVKIKASLLPSNGPISKKRLLIRPLKTGSDLSRWPIEKYINERWKVDIDVQSWLA